jgi:hypothetical protein
MTAQRPAFRRPLRPWRSETVGNGSARGQLAGRSLTSNFQSPEFARVLCPDTGLQSAHRLVLLHVAGHRRS